MAITVQDVQELIQIIRERPAWRAEMERALLGEDFLSLPQIVRELAVAQQRTEARVEELAEAQKRTEARVTELAQILAELVEQMRVLSQDVAWLKKDMAEVKGELLELKYIERAPSYLARLIRKGQVIPRSEWVGQIHDAEEAGIYTEDEALELSALDLLARGRRREDSVEAYLPIEVSWTIHDDDITRAARRGDLLRRQYPVVIPVAAGQGFSPDTFVKARELQVTLVIGGQALKPE